MANMTETINNKPFSLDIDKISKFGTCTYNIMYNSEQYGELATFKLAKQIVKTLNTAHMEGIKEGQSCLDKKIQYKIRKPYILAKYTGTSASYSFSIKYEDSTVLNIGNIELTVLAKMLDIINYAYNQGVFTKTGTPNKKSADHNRHNVPSIIQDKNINMHKPTSTHDSHDYIKK